MSRMGDGCAGRDDVAGLEVVAPVTLLVLEAPRTARELQLPLSVQKQAPVEARVDCEAHDTKLYFSKPKYLYLQTHVSSSTFSKVPFPATATACNHFLYKTGPSQTYIYKHLAPPSTAVIE